MANKSCDVILSGELDETDTIQWQLLNGVKFDRDMENSIIFYILKNERSEFFFDTLYNDYHVNLFNR